MGGIAGSLYSGAQIRDTDYSGDIELTQTGSSSAYYSITGLSSLQGAFYSERCNVYGSLKAFTTNADGRICGIWCANDSTNHASIALTAGNGSIYSAGAADGNKLTNKGDVTTILNGTGSYGSHGIMSATNSVNNGFVSIFAENGEAPALGTAECRNSTNNGGVLATVVNGTATAIGGGSLYSVNYGSVNATHENGHAQAVGVDGDYCRNEGSISAHSTGPRDNDLGAAVVYGCSDASSYSYNCGSLSAVSEHCAAYAYGAQDSTSVSTGVASATSNLYEVAAPTWMCPSKPTRNMTAPAGRIP